jgi:Tol biopolymer transport system component
MLLLAAVTIALWPTGPSEPLAMTPFATEFEIQTMARWSPSGDRIAYVAPVNGILQIFEKALEHPTPTQITHELESCFIPFWSADATRIYFITGTQSHTNLRSIAVAGGPSEIVLPGAYRADLSPDGKTLAALIPAAPGSYRLAFSSPPGAPPEPYSRAPLSERRTGGISGFLRYDRSGRFLGLSTVLPTVSFWRIPLSGEAAQEIRKDYTYLVSFDWMDNEKRIIADSSISGGDDQLSIRRLETGERWNLTAGSSKENYPAISPRGYSLAVSTGEAGYKIIEVSLTGSSVRDVTMSARSEVAPSWAPDGMHFAFATNRRGKPEIWLRNSLDGTERLIAGSNELPNTIALYDCAVSPDGTRVAYRQQQEAGGVIWISPITGATPVP